MNKQYKSALLNESQNEIVNEIISALENNHLTTGVAGWTSDDYYIETFTSGGGYIHTLILLNNKHIVAIHFEDGIVEYSFDKFDTIEDYLSEKNQDNEKGFGWEFMQPNHDYRTAELSEGGFTKFFKNVSNEKFKDGGKMEDGGVIGQEIVFDDNGEENTGVIKEIHEITGDYIVATDDGRTVLASKELDVISLGKVREPKAKKRFAFFEDGGTLDSAIEHLPGKVLEFHYMGVNEPEIAKIEEARLSSANYRYRDLFLSIEGNTSTTIPSDKIDEFLSGQMTFVKDSKGNEYGVQLTNVKMKDGGNIGQENNEMFHSQAKEAKHHIEELQKLLTQKTQIESWVLAKMTRAKTDLSDLTHYLEGQSNKMAKGGKIMNLEKIGDEVYDFLKLNGYELGSIYKGASGEIIIEPSTRKTGTKRKDFFDGMQIIRHSDGMYEVSEYMAGPKQDELYIYKETKSLKVALKDLIKGNNRKPVKKYQRGGKLTTNQQKKFDKVMHEWKARKLHSGKNGPIVKDQDQAIAIAYSAARSRK